LFSWHGNYKVRLPYAAIMRRHDFFERSDDEWRTAQHLGDELAAALVRFYAIEVDSRPGELEYDRALDTAKKLEAAVAEIAAGGGRHWATRHFER
jgi:hypothetical protein